MFNGAAPNLLPGFWSLPITYFLSLRWAIPYGQEADNVLAFGPGPLKQEARQEEWPWCELWVCLGPVERKAG